MLRQEIENLEKSNDTITKQLDERVLEIVQLKERIKTNEASYQKEKALQVQLTQVKPQCDMHITI